ncbi:MAG TPA: phosphoesterase, partial [Firmicutes bacterium]|nr:phosphoesterase [Bacillota bacterium]
LQVSNYQIVNKNIPKYFNNYKIIQISDFHNTKSKKLNNDLIKEIKSQKPNIIVITGDLIDAKKTDIDVAINFIKEINEIAPIYFITGNHENSTNDYSLLREQLEENKIIILDNDIEVLKINDSEINLIGVSDPSIIRDSFITDNEIIKSELNNIEYNKNNYTILLSHRPELFDTYVAENLNLVLTGHAHGGQIRIPFIGGLVAPNQGILPKYTSGMFESSKTTMIVSRGIGNSIIPFRINNRPELVVITLSSK